MQDRTNRLQVLLSKDEREALNKVADANGMSASVYARAEILKSIKRDGE